MPPELEVCPLDKPGTSHEVVILAALKFCWSVRLTQLAGFSPLFLIPNVFFLHTYKHEDEAFFCPCLHLIAYN